MNAKRVMTVLLAFFCLTACSMVGKPVTGDAQKNGGGLVLSSSMSPKFGPGVSRKVFEYGTPIYLMLTLDSILDNPPKDLKVVWYNGSTFVANTTFEPTPVTRPWHVWFSIDSAELGVGKGRVEVFADDVLIEKAQFIVLESNTVLYK